MPWRRQSLIAGMGAVCGLATGIAAVGAAESPKAADEIPDHEAVLPAQEGPESAARHDDGPAAVTEARSATPTDARGSESREADHARDPAAEEMLAPGTTAAESTGTVVSATTEIGPLPPDQVGGVTEFPLPAGAQPGGVTSGGATGVWVTEPGRNALAHIDLGGTVTEQFLPIPGGEPRVLTSGPDGRLWFSLTFPTEERIAVASTRGTFEHSWVLPTLRRIRELVVGPDSNIWFVDSTMSSSLWRMALDGVFTEFPIGLPTYPVGLTVGPDSRLWFTADGSPDVIGASTTDGVMELFPIPEGFDTPSLANSPNSIAAGPDGALWFANLTARIGRVTVDGVFSVFEVPNAGNLWDIVSGPDGALWFTMPSAGRIGRITVVGDVAEFLMPVAGTRPFYLSAGPDGTLWFTDLFQDRVGFIRVLPSVRDDAGTGDDGRAGTSKSVSATSTRVSLAGLPTTGSDLPELLAAAGLSLVLAGGAGVVGASRRRRSHAWARSSGD